MAVHERWLILAWVVMLGLTLIGEPAPTAVGPAEAMLVGSVLLLVIAALARARLIRRWQLGPNHLSILAVTAAYCLSLVAGMALGLLGGATPPSVARAAAPYLLFLPVAATGAWLGRGHTIPATVRALVVGGLAHAIFLLVLFGTGVQDLLDLRAVFFGRTTLLDARTTVPLFLASALLPLAWIGEGSAARRVGAVLLVTLSVAGALSTQTRSQLLALAMGMATFLPCYGIWWARRNGRSLARAGRRMVLVGVAGTLVVGTATATVPTLRVLVQAVTLRTAADQDNGRIANEWIPAVQQVSATAGSMVLGIGAGRSFITGEGEERTYVHNLGIYSLVYGGVSGVVVVVLFYLIMAMALARRFHREASLESAALLALLVAMATYAQFFAVHKLLSYNLMLALIAQAAASRLAPSSGSVDPA